ncbi:hypothetical protein [Campylobacter mucosalis]|nr:hypothetical protein [Campylobacter mucosalis]
MFYQIFSRFHKAILPFFVLIFLTGCGYKADPFYEKPTQKSSKTEAINKI